MSRLFRAGLVILGLGTLAGAGVAVWIVARGVSAREESSSAETEAARMARHLAIPGAFRRTSNPVPATREALARARAHFANLCAVCHGNDGSGRTGIGRSLYPRAPDLRLVATQSMTDGELFAIIHSGVRLTGMPAWGDTFAESDRETWELVHFVRHLPHLAPAELEEMQALNPRSAAEWEDEKRIEELLRRGPTPTPTSR